MASQGTEPKPIGHYCGLVAVPMCKTSTIAVIGGLQNEDCSILGSQLDPSLAENNLVTTE